MVRGEIALEDTQ